MDEFSTPDKREIRWTYDFCFEADLPLKNEKATIVEEGDIINILTLINLSFPDLGEDEYDNTYIGNTYLATFLIELDPL